MPAYWLEATVVVLGLILLLMEAFGKSSSRELMRRVAIGGLAFILVPLYIAVAPPRRQRGTGTILHLRQLGSLLQAVGPAVNDSYPPYGI